MLPDVVYLGDFSTNWSTEAYVADALEAAGCRVIRAEETCYTATSFTELTRAEVRHDVPTVFLFCKARLRGMEDPPLSTDRRKHIRYGFGGNPQKLGDMLSTFKERTGVSLTVCWQFDLMRSEYCPIRHKWASTIAPLCDLFLSTDAGLGIGRLLRQGYPGPVGMESPQLATSSSIFNVAHMGSIQQGRHHWYWSMRNIGIHHFTNVRGDILFEACRSARVIVGPSYPYYGSYWSNRLYVVTGYGGLLACPEVPGMAEEGWIAGKHYLPLPLDDVKAVNAVRNILGTSNSELEAVRVAGQQHCWQHHTYRHRVADLISMWKERL